MKLPEWKSESSSASAVAGGRVRGVVAGLVLAGMMGVAPAVVAASASNSFQVGMTIVNSPEDVAASMRLQSERLQRFSAGCRDQGSPSAVEHNWIADHAVGVERPAVVRCHVVGQRDAFVVIEF